MNSWRLLKFRGAVALKSERVEPLLWFPKGRGCHCLLVSCIGATLHRDTETNRNWEGGFGDGVPTGRAQLEQRL